jgi:hypothetical protein
VLRQCPQCNATWTISDDDKSWTTEKNFCEVCRCELLPPASSVREQGQEQPQQQQPAPASSVHKEVQEQPRQQQPSLASSSHKEVQPQLQQEQQPQVAVAQQQQHVQQQPQQHVQQPASAFRVHQEVQQPQQEQQQQEQQPQQQWQELATGRMEDVIVRVQTMEAVQKVVLGAPAALNIWEVELQRQLDLAVQGLPLPSIIVGRPPAEQGAWMAFLWDLSTSSGKTKCFFYELECPGMLFCCSGGVVR